MNRFDRWGDGAAVALLVLAGTVPAGAQTCTLQSSTIPLPLVNLSGTPPAGAYGVSVSIDGGPGKALLVDTGSTGIVVPSTVVPQADWNASTAMGQIYYTSDDVYHPGKYVTVPIRLGVSADGTTAAASVSSIEILAAQCTCGVQASASPQPAPTAAPATCAGYNGTQANVPNTSLELLNCQPIAAGFGMMGVGYDRGAPTAKNAFLRVQQMDQGAMSPGYIISGSSITLGVSEAALQGFTMTGLTSNAAPIFPGQPNPPDWQAPNACATFPNSGTSYSVCGPLLPDTGINYMMLTAATGSPPPASLNSGGTVPNGTQMTITVGPTGSQILTYTYPTGGAPPAPASVQWRGPVAPPAHINSGRYTMAAGDYAYDAACGRAGFRQPAAQ